MTKYIIRILLVIIILLIFGCIWLNIPKDNLHSHCPVVGHRLNVGPHERWLDCDGDGLPEYKQYYTFKDGQVSVLKEEYVKGKFK